MRWFKNYEVGKMTCRKNFLKKCKKTFSIYHCKNKALSWSYFERIRKKKKMKHAKFIYNVYTIDRVTLSAIKFAVNDKKYK